MDAQEGSVKFKEADALFQQGRFEEALVLLDALEASFPNTKNIMYPRALCLLKAGRLDEAEFICNGLASQFQDPRSQTLKQHIDAARAALDPFAGLNADGLDDLFDKPRKTAPPQAASADSGMSRYARVGAIVAAVLAIAVLGYVGYTKGWFPGGGESLEQVQAKIMDAWAKADAYSGFINLTGKMKQGGMDLGFNGGGSLDYMKKDAKPLFRLEGSISLTGLPMPMDIPVLAVGDGTTAYNQVSFMGKQMIMKMPMPPSSTITPDVAKMFFEQLQKEFDMRLLREEMLDGKPAYPFEMTPKAGSTTAASMAKTGQDVAKLKVSFTKDFTSQVRCDVLDKTGAATFTLSLKDINFSPTLAPDRFTYKPPEGAQIIDMSDPASVMKLMGPGGFKPF